MMMPLQSQYALMPPSPYQCCRDDDIQSETAANQRCSMMSLRLASYVKLLLRKMALL